MFLLSDFLGTAEYAYGWKADVGLLLTLPTYALFVAAMYHPMVIRLTETPEDQMPQLSLTRAASLAAASIVPCIALLIGVRRDGGANVSALILSSFTMAVLVTYRLYQLGQTREVMAVRSDRLRQAGELLIAASSEEEVFGALAGATRGSMSTPVDRVEIALAIGEQEERVVHTLPGSGPRPPLETQTDFIIAGDGSIQRIFGSECRAFALPLGPWDDAAWLVLYGTSWTNTRRTHSGVLPGGVPCTARHRCDERSRPRGHGTTHGGAGPELIRIFMVVADSSLTVTFVSPAIRTVLGHQPEDLMNAAR